VNTTEVVQILREIPTAYVRLHVAITGPRRKGGGAPKVSGGTRDFTPINVEAENQKVHLHDHVLDLHRVIAETFGEPRAIGIQDACDDLVKWVELWTRLPLADEMVDGLRMQLRRSNKITGHSEEPQRLPQTVCPNCLSIGGMFLDGGNGEDERYGCEGCGISYSPGEYAQAVREALTKHSPAA